MEERNGKGSKIEVSDFCKHELCLVSPYVSLKEQTMKEPKSSFLVWENRNKQTKKKNSQLVWGVSRGWG